MEADKQRNGPFYLFHFNEKQVVISNNHFHGTRRIRIKALVNDPIIIIIIIIIIIMSILMLIIVTIVDIMIRAVIKLPPVVWPRCWQPPRP